MATFTGTLGADRFIGADFVADEFVFTPATFTGIDRVVGGIGGNPDVLRFTAAGVINGQALARARGIEQIQLHFSGPNSLILTNNMVASSTAASLLILGDSGNDFVNGLVLEDPNRIVVNGGFGDDDLRAGAANDALNGQGGNDTLRGSAGDDRLNGGLDDDLLIGGSGADVLIGAQGADTIRFDNAAQFNAAALVDGSIGNVDDDFNRVQLETSGAYTFTGKFKHIDIIELRRNVVGYDITLTNAMAETANDQPFGNVRIEFAGNFTRGVSVDASDLRAGNLVRIGEFLGDDPTNNGRDTFTGGAGEDFLIGKGGADRLDGGPGDDVLEGGEDPDVIIGGPGSDLMSDNEGGGANFIIFGSDDFDPPFAEKDRIFGSGERITLDQIELRGGGLGFYDMVGVVNIDQILLVRPNGNYNLTLSATGGDANQDGVRNDLLITPLTKIERGVFINGATPGGAPALIVDGATFEGDDNLRGGGIEDVMHAGPGSDTLTGGGLNDDLTGGAGADIYRFLHILDSIELNDAFDLINGFEARDRVDLSALGLNGARDDILIKGVGEFPGDDPPVGFFFRGPVRYAVAVQSDGETTRVYVDTSNDGGYQPNGTQFTPPDTMIEFVGNVRPFLDDPSDYIF